MPCLRSTSAALSARRADAGCWHLPALSSSGLRPPASADSLKLGRVCLGRVRLRRAWIRRVGDALRAVRVGLSQQVGTANGAHDRQHTSGDDHCQLANFLIVSSPVWVGLMPSLPPGFSESETLRQAGDSCRPGSPLRRFAPRSSSSNCALASASSRRRRSTSDSSARAALSRHAASSLASAP